MQKDSSMVVPVATEKSLTGKYTRSGLVSNCQARLQTQLVNQTTGAAKNNAQASVQAFERATGAYFDMLALETTHLYKFKQAIANLFGTQWRNGQDSFWCNI